jgi:hypothetical protein
MVTGSTAECMWSRRLIPEQGKLSVELDDGSAKPFDGGSIYCGLEDANFGAFVEATSIIGGHDAVEEFLTCGLWPLSENFGF